MRCKFHIFNDAEEDAAGIYGSCRGGKNRQEVRIRADMPHATISGIPDLSCLKGFALESISFRLKWEGTCHEALRLTGKDDAWSLTLRFAGLDEATETMLSFLMTKG
ncbi:unnamed protein product [Dovyalis caffra]|uniref:Uncharacterized protein n=1 Tax=Dovyalis caffra TaxID=77055 RepID=A0AAV1RD95_9ROSI|nr:unnamed protein product [Dovyalis caffra]